MKIVVIGGKGLIGSKLVSKLTAKGHDVLSASPSTGVDIVTGKGLNDALKDAKVVVDVSNPASFEENAVVNFFETAGNNLMEAELEAGIWHHVALSIVGTQRLKEHGYFKGKGIQEEIIENSHVPYTIVQATQFFEFLGGIADSAGKGQSLHLPSAYFQPIAAEDVANMLVNFIVGSPLIGTVEIAGPEPFRMADLVQKYLRANHDARSVVADPNATYFGLHLKDDTLLPEKKARLAPTKFETWFAKQSHPAATSN